jgi:pimeloyl-ACP methyl ester carboxylesterase
VARLSRIVLYPAAAWAAWRLWGPEVQPRFRGIQERPVRLPGRSVFVGQREFFVREAGDPEAPPLVLLHGWNFDGEATFHAVVPELAERYRVVLVDLRGHGKSDRVRGRYDIEDSADELAGVITALGLRPAIVLGYSMGGFVAQALAMRHPGAVDGLILAATAARPIGRFRLLWRLSFWVGRAIARVSPTEGARVTLAYMKQRKAVAPRHERWLFEELMDRDPTLYYETGAAIWRFDSRDWVGRLRARTMVIVTAGDLIVDPKVQRELAGLVKDATVVELAGAGHEAIISHPAGFVAAIDRFVAG